MLVLGNGRHVKHSAHNHFSCICSLCTFYFVQDFCISVDQLFFNLILISENTAIFAGNASWILKPRREKKEAFCCHKVLLKYFHSLLHLIIPSNHSSTLGESDWQELKMETTNKQWYWWHPPHQESLHQKESMSDRWSITFPRYIFCDVWGFYAFNDLCIAPYQKQGTANSTERTM